MGSASMMRVSGRCQTFHRGKLLYRQDDAADGWLEIGRGTVRLCQYYGDGRRQVLTFAVEGDVIGVDGGFRLCSAEALTDGEAIWRRCDEPLSDVCEPDVAFAYRSALSRALRSAEENLKFFSYPTAIERLSAFLLNFDRRRGSPGDLELPMSRLDIAEHLGLTMHTISRAFSQLARNGLIESPSPHRIVLRDRMKLAQFVGIEDYETAAGPLSMVA